MGPEFEKGDGRLRPSLQNNASPAQRGPRRDAQPLHATPLAAVLFPARGANSYTKIEIRQGSGEIHIETRLRFCRRAPSRPSLSRPSFALLCRRRRALAMECRRAEEPFEPRPQSCLRFGISTLLVGALCIAVGLSYKDVPSAYAASRFAKEDVPSATMTVSGMLYNGNILFHCPYEMSNVTVNFYGDSHPSPEVKKSP